MLALLLFVTFGLFFGYFATLNTTSVSINMWGYPLEGVPLYLLALASLGIGILLASVFYIFKSLSSQFALGKKERELENASKEIAEVTKKVHELELDNTRLKTETEEVQTGENAL